MPDRGIMRGEPVAKANPKAWIQIAAVSKEQTKNTMTLFPTLFSEKCKAEHSIDIGKEVIYAYHGARRIESVTSSPKTLEGARPSLVIKNETHHWHANNDGHEMADVIERNATKSKGGAARSLSITNAYEPSEDSVAQHEREAWEAENAGLAIGTGTLYDSLEAAAEATLRPSKRPGDPEPTEEQIKSHLARIVETVRGDAWWLDVETIVKSILNRRNKPSRSRRFYFNQVVAAEDAWADPAAVTAAIHPLAAQEREHPSADQLRAGWLVLPDEEIVMFGDGSKSDDSTGLVGVRLSDGYVFTIGVWQKPKGERGEHWLAPREAVSHRVDEAFERFNIVAFFFDPSHALDDEDNTRYWDGFCDAWMQKYKDRLQVWATKTGHRAHAVMFDMTSPERQQLFAAAAELFIEDLETTNDVEEYRPRFKIDGHPALVQHMKNAKRYPMKWGVTLMKEHRESAKKIDLAVCAVGGRMLRRMVLNRGLDEEKDSQRPGVVWGAW